MAPSPSKGFGTVRATKVCADAERGQGRVFRAAVGHRRLDVPQTAGVESSQNLG